MQRSFYIIFIFSPNQNASSIAECVKPGRLFEGTCIDFDVDNAISCFYIYILRRLQFPAPQEGYQEVSDEFGEKTPVITISQNVRMCFGKVFI